jgi:hypothetical protein
MVGAAVLDGPPQNRPGGQFGRPLASVAVAAVCAGIAGGVVLVADRGPAAGDVAPHDLVVTEVLTAPMVDPDGIVFSVALRNDGAEAVFVADVTTQADDGVDVEVLGASTCRHGCAGAMAWADAESMMERSIEWSDGFRVPAEQDVLAGRADAVKVVLRVRPADADAERRLANECLAVRRLVARVGNGVTTTAEPARRLRRRARPERRGHAWRQVGMPRRRMGARSDRMRGRLAGCGSPARTNHWRVSGYARVLSPQR